MQKTKGQISVSRKLLFIGLALSILLNVFWISLFVYERSQKKLSTTLKEKIAASSDSELNFLIEFSERWFHFRTENFEAGQLTLTTWLAPEFSEHRQQEIRRISAKMQGQEISQVARLQRIDQTGVTQFLLENEVDLNENGHLTHFRVINEARLSQAELSPVNTWGFQILSFDSSPPQQAQEPSIDHSLLPLKVGAMTKLELPCPVQKYSEINDQLLQIKVVSSDSSEVQILPKQAFTENVQLSLSCEKLLFRWTLAPNAQGPVIRYLRVPQQWGTEIKTPPPTLQIIQQAPAKKISTELKQSLKKLGVEPDESESAK